ncbi:MAG: aminotransferase class IV [Candidatus Omnitrophota bacterium]
MNYKIYQDGKEVTGKMPFALMRTEAVGIFESMRAYGGKVLHVEEHLSRLLESARTVGYKPFPDAAKLRREMRAAFKASGERECYVRLTLWEGSTFVILGSREHSKELYEKGVALKMASFPRGGPNTFPWQAKASVYQQAILATTEPHPDKIYEWIFLEQGGGLTETRVGNFFIVKYRSAPRRCETVHPRGVKRGEAILLTPPEHLILNGVTRKIVINCALALGMKVREVPLTRHEFFNADEAFLCNTSWEVLPVRELDGRAIGNGKPGPVTLKLHRFFKRRIQHDVTSYRSPRAH